MSKVSTNSEYKGDVTLRLKLKNKTIELRKRNKGLLTLSKAFALYISNNASKDDYVPQFIDLQWIEYPNQVADIEDLDNWESFLLQPVSISGLSYMLDDKAYVEQGQVRYQPNWVAVANARIPYSYLSSQGFNNAAICGILANIESESGFSTTALGDGGTSYGICQWHEGRWDSLKDYCSENNLDSDSLEGQAQYLVSELKNSYPDVYETLQNVPNTAEGAYQAAYKWTTDFEIPEDKYSEGENRGDNAQTTYWEKYGSK